MCVMPTKKTFKKPDLKPRKAPYLQKHASFCCRVFASSSQARRRNALISNASDSQVLALCECIKNVLNCVCPVSAKQKAHLGKYQKALIRLCEKKSSLPVVQRKKLLQQKGAGVFLPLIGSAIASYLMNKITG